MRRTLGLAAIVGLGWLAAAVAWAGPAANAPPAWPQAHSDLTPDPAVRFGVLANGMRYAVMRNTTPGGQTSLRLRIGSGSLEEDAAQQGLAHILEHMAFKGSTHVAAGDMVKILQREGLAFGADTNAETEWTQTVYQFNLPRSDPPTLDTGLMLMRETAGNLTLDAAALTPERGVVLSEQRLRDTPEYRAEKAQIDLLAQGQRITRRFPIGQVEVIEQAPVALIKDFYRANYRPDRATLIAVGDFDPAAMEAKIKARFSDWKPVGPPTAEPDLGSVEPRGLTTRVVILPGSSTRSLIAWVQPHDASLDTAAKRRRDTVDALALAVLNRRLQALVNAPHPPFLAARASFDDLLHSDKVAMVETVSTPDAWRPALDGADHAVRRLVAHGVGEDELAREIDETRAQLVNAVAGAATRDTPTLANDLVDAVDDDEVFTDPAEDLALFEKDVKGLTAAKVGAAAGKIFAGAGPIVELTSPQPIEGGDAALAVEYDKARAEPVDAQASQAQVAWPYANFGPAGVVAKRTDIADLGAVAVRFANGVGLIVKPTQFAKDQVLVNASVGTGREGLPKDRPVATWAAAGFVNGGLKAIDFEDSRRALAGKIYGAKFTVGDQAFELAGATDPKDLATQLQVLAAYVADPGFRPEAFARIRAAYLSALAQLEGTPEGVLGRDLEGLLHAGDPRWAFPTRDELDAAKPGDLKDVLAGPMAHGPVEVTIVGDVTVDAAIAQVAATFGALPRRPSVAILPSGARQVDFPAPTAEPVKRSDAGRPDQAIAVVAWPLTGFYVDTRRSRAAMLAGEVLANRILDQVRIARGDSYSPETAAELSETFPRYGVAFSVAQTPPGKVAAFYASVAAITADMRARAVTPDELARARNPRVAGIEKARLTNQYWLTRLTGALADPRRLDLIRTTLPDYTAITAADVQAAARAYFVDDKAWKLVVEPAGVAAGQDQSTVTARSAPS
ncbi:MAG: M16 family metallopeptidase [Caulobacteraceae bacterium]